MNKGKKIEGEKVNLNIGIKMTEEKQINKEGKSKESLTAVIRISGMVKVPKEIENALYRLKLRRKYSCIIIDTSNKSLLGLLKKVKKKINLSSKHPQFLVAY